MKNKGPELPTKGTQILGAWPPKPPPNTLPLDPRRDSAPDKHVGTCWKVYRTGDLQDLACLSCVYNVCERACV